MLLAASGAPVAVKRRAVEQVNKVEILRIYVICGHENVCMHCNFLHAKCNYLAHKRQPFHL
jgi:hypothetical protein